MNTTTIFKKLSEQINLEAALEESGFDALEIAVISDLEKDILLADFFDKVEDYLIETINDLIIEHFTSIKENKELLK